MRHALNGARYLFEEYVAPVASAERWSDPMPKIPMGRLWIVTDHQDADGVDPWMYVDDVDKERESDSG